MACWPPLSSSKLERDRARDGRKSRELSSASASEKGTNLDGLTVAECRSASEWQAAVNDRGLTPRLCRMGRALLGWSLEDLAFRTGICWRTIDNFEVGRHAPRHHTILALSRAFQGACHELGGAPDGDAPLASISEASAS